MNDRVVIDPDIQHGKPVIRGTRVPITRIIGGLAGGMTKEEIMREYEVTEEDISAALNYAAELIEAEEFHPLPVSGR
jgi:uncharacterized protein (DUF433 family)